MGRALGLVVVRTVVRMVVESAVPKVAALLHRRHKSSVRPKLRIVQ
jgi:hypothetical protein